MGRASGLRRWARARRHSLLASGAALLLLALRRGAGRAPPAGALCELRHALGPGVARGSPLLAGLPAGARPSVAALRASAAPVAGRGAPDSGAGSDEEELDEDDDNFVQADLAELSPDEFLRVMEESGAFEGQEALLQQLRALADRGIHPLQALRVSRSAPQEEPRECMLGSFDIDGIARYILDHKCQRIVVLCGAGISTSAGIPDFRTPGSGLYDNLQRYNLSRPEMIFDLNFFREQPGAFYQLCKELWPGRYDPTLAHYFIRLLHEKGVLTRCYTQNIDSLEGLAGLPKEKIVAAHGNFDSAHVIDTDPEEKVDVSELKAAVDRGEEGWKALRASRGNLVKPKIVFFGEQLPDRFYSSYPADLQSCDLLIVLGTSLVVQPFAGLVGEASRSAPRILVNREPAGTCDRLAFGFRFNLAADGANWRDVWYQGDCDDGCLKLAAALGWEDDLRALMNSPGSAVVQPAPWAAD